MTPAQWKVVDEWAGMVVLGIALVLFVADSIACRRVR